jgi:hypothetical protein
MSALSLTVEGRSTDLYPTTTNSFIGTVTSPFYFALSYLWKVELKNVNNSYTAISSSLATDLDKIGLSFIGGLTAGSTYKITCTVSAAAPANLSATHSLEVILLYIYLDCGNYSPNFWKLHNFPNFRNFLFN